MMSSDFGCVPDEGEDMNNSSVTITLSLTYCNEECICQLDGYGLLGECIEEVR